MRKGKNYVESAKLVDRTKQYDVNEAIDTMLKTAKAKFDETVEIHVKLGVDSRHADQQVRGAIVLPNGTGKTARVLVFAKGDKADAARAAGADYVGDKEILEKLDFIANGDICEVVHVGMSEEMYGFRFADVTLSFGDYENCELDVKIMLGTLTSESPSLTRAESEALFAAVWDDYPEIR